LKNGFRAVFSSDKKTVFILRSNDTGIQGTFKCACGSAGGACTLLIVGRTLNCEGSECCTLITTVESSNTPNTMQDIEQAPEKLTWKKVVLPTKSN
jgi:hypothetical protein